MFASNVTLINQGAKSCLVVLMTLLTSLPSASNMSVRAAPAYTDVSGPIISDTTWTLANSPYIVIANVEVWQGVTLTIQPGVVVKFNKDRLLQVDGTLIARGAAANPIIFTANQASPQKGDWKNINFADSSVDATFDSGENYTGGSILEYCIVEYGGNGVDGAVQTNHASPLIDHCTVRNNQSSGITGIGTDNTSVIIRNNTVSGNSTPRGGGGIYASFGVVIGNTVSGNSATRYYGFSGGGGIYASDSTVISNTVNDNSVSGGDEYGGGGGIYAYHSTAMGNTVSGNSVDGIYGIYGGGIYAMNNSQVTGNTVSGNSAVHGGGIRAKNNSQVTGNTVSGNAAAYAGGGIYATANSPVTSNIVRGNSATYRGGGIYADSSPVTGNIVSGNSANGYDAFGGGILTLGGDARNSIVISNTVSGNSASSRGGGICVGDGFDPSSTVVMSNTITANSVTRDTGQGSGVYIFRSSDFLYNIVVGNVAISPTAVIGGVAINGTPQFHHNNLYGNSNYDVVVLSSQDISGTHNYWGTVATVDILTHVYDWYDDSTRGRLLYIPYLQDPDLNAPVPPPQNLRANFSGGSASLSWDVIPSTTTGYGYKVYYDTDASGPPYHGTGAVEGNSPIDVGNATHFTLSGLGGRIYIAVTAYDTQGRESWYSNEANSLRRVYLPVVLK